MKMMKRMNKRGELEIAINRRTVERSVFVLIIVVLAVLLALRWNGNSSVDADEVTQLQTELDTATSQIATLEAELEEIKEADTPEPETVTPTPAAVAAEPTPQTPALSGTVSFSWVADGGAQTPTEYNADAIKKLEDELASLEEELDDATGAERTQINDEIDEVEDEITALKTGAKRLRLRSVVITIDNGKADPGVFDYTLCWLSFDCAIVKTSGTINVPSGKSVTHQVELTMPTFLQLDKTQILHLGITQDGKEVFKEDKSFKG